MADQYIDLPLRSVGSITAPGLASEATLVQVRDAVLALGGLKTIVGKLFFDYSVTNVGPGAWVQLIAATADVINFLTWSESGGYPMEIAIGAAGFETSFLNIPPGGFNGELPMPIPNGSRVSIRCLVQPKDGAGANKNVDAGNIVANFLK